MKRKVEVVVLSDIHLGSYGCHAKELNEYLKSIDPDILILNGDIMDGYVFNKNYFPVEHFEVIKNILSMLKRGTKVYYIPGNHDDFLRELDDIHMDNLHKVDKLILELDGKTHWFFHGDVFDMSMQGKLGKSLAKIGGQAYDMIILINRIMNKLLVLLNKKPYSLSKKIKDNVKSAVKYVSDFEEMSCEHAIKQGFDVVVNGHIHQPKINTHTNPKGSVVYLNSGDYVENLSSLEYNNKQWKIHYHWNKD
jgi:UDP-2,3-diacylglucosamine pyrophosphatase LpxH